MRTYLETIQLVLREFTTDDVDNLLELDSDPEVMRYFPGEPGSREPIRDMTLPRLIQRYREHEGFGTSPPSPGRRGSSWAGSNSGPSTAIRMKSSSATV